MSPRSRPPDRWYCECDPPDIDADGVECMRCFRRPKDLPWPPRARHLGVVPDPPDYTLGDVITAGRDLAPPPR